MMRFMCRSSSVRELIFKRFFSTTLTYAMIYSMTDYFFLHFFPFIFRRNICCNENLLSLFLLFEQTSDSFQSRRNSKNTIARKSNTPIESLNHPSRRLTSPGSAVARTIRIDILINQKPSQYQHERKRGGGERNRESERAVLPLGFPIGLLLGTPDRKRARPEAPFTRAASSSPLIRH